MKRFTKSNLATGLQVLAVIIIFSYARHSSNTESKEFSPLQTSIDRDTSIVVRPVMNIFFEGPVTGILFNQKVAEQAR